MPDAFVARQPIFNPKLDVVGYELLFRGEGYANDVAVIANPESATATVVLNALTELDLARIVGYKPAWINVSRSFVTGGLAHAVPPGLVGLEIPETEQFDDEMIATLRALKADGYQLALDDFQYRDGAEALLRAVRHRQARHHDLGRETLWRPGQASQALPGQDAGREARDADRPRVLPECRAAICSRATSFAALRSRARGASRPTAWHSFRSLPPSTTTRRARADSSS